MGSHRQSNIGGWINLEWIHFRYDLRAEQSPWLESVEMLALRTLLAGSEIIKARTKNIKLWISPHSLLSYSSFS